MGRIKVLTPALGPRYGFNGPVRYLIKSAQVWHYKYNLRKIYVISKRSVNFPQSPIPQFVFSFSTKLVDSNLKIDVLLIYSNFIILIDEF